LVNGGSGGVGTFAVQVAKSQGAEVTGVCSGANVEMVRSIGADKVIDYTQEDFTTSAERYDIIFECVGNKSFSECRRVMKDNARFLGIGAPHDVSIVEIITALTKGIALSAFSKKKMPMFIAKSSQPDLTTLGELVATRKITPVIDRRYTLAETPEAVRYLEAGHARGKVLILVAD
jgi:NADPH:quinone reductase-like Zn-dependent oxidoreductase